MGWTGIAISQSCFLQDVHTSSFSYVRRQEKSYSVWTKCTGIHCWPRSREWRASSPPLAKLRKILVFVTHWAAKGKFCKNNFKPFGKILNLWLHSYECICLYMKLIYFYDTFLCSWFIQIFFSLVCLQLMLVSVFHSC